MERWKSGAMVSCLNLVSFPERKQTERLEKAGTYLEGCFWGASGNGTNTEFTDREFSRSIWGARKIYKPSITSCDI